MDFISSHVFLSIVATYKSWNIFSQFTFIGNSNSKLRSLYNYYTYIVLNTYVYSLRILELEL